ncbi:hypothetical protein FKV75_00985 [Weissella paramesenteroides]|uniref:hypothetical protein n=1 Tax=Weissella paramesenteroides TaxID=1249 RepID=UPI00123B616F|nr:hypothetical protein [Weissella paramesenteroides]KAA8442518.1 hypothetical protein FKV77_04690 [Weissella paramesenteroides]KAA8442865.1 hypothetical protein FKV81_00680 [Weissella paramesenteroides]KAA8444460.1 hypothetical protein FKV75_00985 [Weissella paramesenteroides]KAA8448127.1 hypothetical protein FKV76_02550 [Weissella paramesenteroides]KAA8452061.1 hypothetical protein FKV74_00680 [Weissella paramesenteroides]
MISLYILLIASIVAIFGLFVTVFAHVKKIDRSKRMGHFFLTFGVIVALFAGFSINKEKEAHQAAEDHQKRVQAEQIYDAELIHLSAKKVTIKDGEAKVTIHVSKNTAVKIYSNHEQLHDLEYKPNNSKKDIKITFVMPGKYTVKATRGQNRIIKHITVSKDNHKKVTASTSTSSSSSEVVEETSSEPVVDDSAVSEETSTEETVVDPALADSAATDTTTTDVTPSYDYTPTWTPDTSAGTTTTTPATGAGTTTGDGSADNGTQGSDSTSGTGESTSTADATGDSSNTAQ